MGAELKSSKYINDSEFVEAFMEKSIAYKFNNERGIAPDYGALGQGASNYYDSYNIKDYIFSSKIYYFYCYRNKNCVIGMM